MRCFRNRPSERCGENTALQKDYLLGRSLGYKYAPLTVITRLYYTAVLDL